LSKGYGSLWFISFDAVLAWLIEQVSTDSIEEVTDEMLEMLINNNREIAVLFCKEESPNPDLLLH